MSRKFCNSCQILFTLETMEIGIKFLLIINLFRLPLIESTGHNLNQHIQNHLILHPTIVYSYLQELASQWMEMFARCHSPMEGPPTTRAQPGMTPAMPGATLPMEFWHQLVTNMPTVICPLVVTLLSSNFENSSLGLFRI